MIMNALRYSVIGYPLREDDIRFVDRCDNRIMKDFDTWTVEWGFPKRIAESDHPMDMPISQTDDVNGLLVDVLRYKRKILDWLLV